MGHLITAPADHPSNFLHYLYSSCCFKASSASTELRVFYEASSKTSSGISLNDKLRLVRRFNNSKFWFAFANIHIVCLNCRYTEMHPQVMLDAKDQDQIQVNHFNLFVSSLGARPPNT